MTRARYFSRTSLIPGKRPAWRAMPLPGAVLAVCLMALVTQAQGVAPPPVADFDQQKATQPLAEVEAASDVPARTGRALDDQPDVYTHYKAALELVGEVEFESAIKELDAALNLADGDCYDLLYLLAQANQRLGRHGEARLAAEHAAVYRPGDANVHHLLGRLYREQGRMEPAIRHFRAATLAAEREPDNARVTAAWYELGQCLAETGYLAAATEAMEQFDRALWVTHPQHRSAAEVTPILAQHPRGTFEQRLELLKRLNRLAERARAAREAVDTQPNEPYLKRLYVLALLDAGQAEEAFDFCREQLGATESRPATEPAGSVSPDAGFAGSALLGLTIDTAIAAGRFEAWVAQLKADLAQGRHVDFALRLARRLDESKHPDLSVPLWQALSEQRPESADDVWALASALKESGDLAGAIDSLIGFVRHNPHGAEIPLQRLEDWMRSFEVTDGFLSLVTTFTARDDCDFATHSVLGMTAAAAGQTELAERLFRAAVESRPDLALTQVAWGRMELAAYRWKEAQAHGEQALAAEPDLAAAHLLVADAHAGLDEDGPAEAAYKAALARRPADVGYVLALARHYRRVGKPLGAQRYLQQAWSLDHTCGEAVEDLVDAYLEGGKAEIAHACLKEAEASDLPDDVLRRIRTSLQFAETPMGPGHLAELTRQFDEFPADTRTGLKLAAGLYLTDQAERALDVLNRVQAREPDHEGGQYLLARIYLHLLEADRGIAVLEQMAKRYPRRVNTLTLLAEAYLTDFRVTEARETLKRVLGLDLEPKERDEHRAQLLNTHLEFMEYEAGQRLVDGWLAEEPGSEVWPRAKLRILLLMGRAEEAADLAAAHLAPVTAHFNELAGQFQSVAARLEEEPNDTQSQAQGQAVKRELDKCVQELYARRSEFVQVCMDGGRWEPAEREIRAWLAVQPGQPQLQEWLIEALLAGHQGEAALEVIATLVPKSPENVIQAITWRSRSYAASGRLDDAVRDLTTLLREPFVRGSLATTTQVRREIVTLLTEAQDYQQAVGLCDEWLATADEGDRSQQFGVLGMKKYVLQAAEREDELIEVSQKLLAFLPRDAGLNNDLGYSWVDRGENLERGLEMIRRAVAAEPLNPAFLDSLGWAYYKQGNFDAARLHLSRAVQLRTGQEATLFDHLGDAEYRLGDRDAARERWSKALALVEDEKNAERAARFTELVAGLRSKLAALDRSESPAVAPTAVEQQQKERP